MKTLRTSILGAAFASLLVFAPRADAVVYDLTTQSTVVVPTIYGDAIFTTDFTRPTGTGVFDPFLTIQANGVEQGYNTSAGVFDTKREPQWNHEVRLYDLTTVEINGVEYFSFLIDINEPNGAKKSQISLDALKIFTSQTAGQTTTDVESLGVKRFDLDLPSDNYIKYDDKNSGSGQSDIAFFIPTASFLTGPNAARFDDYVYMYQMFGKNISAEFDAATGGGFEETRIGPGKPLNVIPEVSSILPLAGLLGMVVSAHHWRRRRTA